jgi:hypothetical protein
VCSNPTKGVGGITFVEHVSDPNAVYDFPEGAVTSQSCGWDEQADSETVSCKGPPNGQIQYDVCTGCTASGSSVPTYSFACSTGYMKNDNGDCVPIDPKQQYGACPPGSYYMNATQNCVDDSTQKPVSVCPPGFTAQYLPNIHECVSVKAFPVAYNCQTFQFKLGACPAANQAAIKIVPFCQNNDANLGGANLTIPPGSTLSVDVKGNRLQSCTPSATRADGTQLFTCLGTGGMTFEAKLCTDANTCTTYQEALGACIGKNNREPIPPPAPSCSHC